MPGTQVRVTAEQLDGVFDQLAERMESNMRRWSNRTMCLVRSRESSSPTAGARALYGRAARHCETLDALGNAVVFRAQDRRGDYVDKKMKLPLWTNVDCTP